MDLKLDPDDLNTCVQCGLCLPHCPTFRVTGDEAMSPRGRIKLMREVQDGDAPLTDDVIRSFETCVQCRGCEPACPSGVPYGHLMEQTRETLAEATAQARAGIKSLPGLAELHKAAHAHHHAAFEALMREEANVKLYGRLLMAASSAALPPKTAQELIARYQASHD